MSPNLILEALHKRRTCKAIGDTDKPELPKMQDNDLVNKLLLAAGNAPFHVPCDRAHQATRNSIVPWRVYALDANACRKLMDRFLANGNATKIPAMLAAAEYLLQVTWLPDPWTSEPSNDPAHLFEPTMRNMEHIASSSAFVQSLLLAGESAGFRTYWSSGGELRSNEVFDSLATPREEILIGSIFLFPQTAEHAEFKPGSHANSRGNLDDWCHWPELD